MVDFVFLAEPAVEPADWQKVLVDDDGAADILRRAVASLRRAPVVVAGAAPGHGGSGRVGGAQARQGTGAGAGVNTRSLGRPAAVRVVAGARARRDAAAARPRPRPPSGIVWAPKPEEEHGPERSSALPSTEGATVRCSRSSGGSGGSSISSCSPPSSISSSPPPRSSSLRVPLWDLLRSSRRPPSSSSGTTRAREPSRAISKLRCEETVSLYRSGRAHRVITRRTPPASRRCQLPASANGRSHAISLVPPSEIPGAATRSRGRAPELGERRRDPRRRPLADEVAPEACRRGEPSSSGRDGAGAQRELWGDIGTIWGQSVAVALGRLVGYQNVGWIGG